MEAPAASVEELKGAVDLALEDLQLAARATTIAGPAYRLRFRNQGTAAAGAFHIVLLAGVGTQPASDAPRAVVQAPEIGAGESLEIVLRLPASAMQMVGANGQRIAMTHVFVALDFTDAIAELDELNNLAIVEAGALETALR